VNGFAGPGRMRVFVPLFVFAVVVGGVLPSLSTLAQTLESRVENLEAHDEILRSRQQVLTGEVNEFKEDVAGATAALRAEIGTEDAAIRAEMATEVTTVREEVGQATAALRAEMHALNSLAAADGSPAQAVYVDNSGRVGIGTTSPGKKLHVAGDAIIGGTLEVSGHLRGFPVADFDSGWFAVSTNRTYGIEHNLEMDDLPSKILIYVSNHPAPVPGTHPIYLMNQAQFYYNSSGNPSGMGAYVRILNNNQIDIMTGDSWIFYALRAGNPAGPGWTSGYYRVRIWK